ncbi:MAG: GntR family transcriptional regulator [Clostridiales bacterium]|mgnify:CR=1 FL=1|nr:GntR family transcriptional regulator [Clostridiales bacterium]
MFSIDSRVRIPIYEQLYKRVLELVVKGVLKENEQLPAVRVLAKDIGINPNTVQKAYQELERDGIIYSQPGKGSYVASLDTVMGIAHERAMNAFTEATVDALNSGVSKEDLHKVIDNTFLQKKDGGL